MQTFVTAVVVLVATAYVGRSLVRTLRTAMGYGHGCASGCGKCSVPVAATPESKRRVALPQV